MMNLEGMSLKQLRQAESELTAWLAVETDSARRTRLRAQLDLVTKECKQRGKRR